MLNGICPRRQRTDGKLEDLSITSETGFPSLNSTKGYVHGVRVRRNTMIALISRSGEQSITHSEMLGGTETWKNKMIYVSRFLSNGIEKFKIVESDDIVKVGIVLLFWQQKVILKLKVLDDIFIYHDHDKYIQALCQNEQQNRRSKIVVVENVFLTLSLWRPDMAA